MSITKKIAHAGIGALTIAALLIGIAAPASASTLDFDSIPTPNCQSAVPDLIPTGFGGFTWDANLAVECDADFKGPGSFYTNNYGAPSGPNAIYNQFGTTSEVITRAAQFQFDGAMVSGWTIDNLVDLTFTATSITIKGFLGGSLVGTETVTLEGADGTSALGYLSIGSIAGAIDKLQITSDNSWLLDDFQYEDIGTTTTVPEPASALLLGSGLLGLLALRRRKGAVSAH